MKIQAALLTVLTVFVIANGALAEDKDLQTLDPKKAEDRALLLNIVAEGQKGRITYNAANILAESGYMDDLLEILGTTTNYSTMQVIAQTKDERALPILELRLREDPHNVYLVGAIGGLKNPKASPILLDLLNMHPDNKEPNQQDIVACILRAIAYNNCQDACPALRQRFNNSRTETDSQLRRKSHYALTLLSLGDTEGLPWLKQQFRKHIDSGGSWTADELATICESRTGAFRIEDEAIMAPLLPELVDGASSPEHFLARDCCRVLRALTRHNFPAGKPGWKEWYERHADKHPIYTKTLDRAAKLCVDTFCRRMRKASEDNETATRMVAYLRGEPRNGYGAHNDFLWKMESRPEFHAISLHEGPHLSREELQKLGLVFVVALTSRVKEPEHLLFRKDFPDINLTVCLGSAATDEATKDLLRQCADESCEALQNYENFHKAKTPKRIPSARTAGLLKKFPVAVYFEQG